MIKTLYRVLAACAAVAILQPASIAQMTDPTPQPALVTVTGKAKQRVVPDQLTFSFQVMTEGENLLAAKSENAKRVNEAISYLKKAGVPATDIRTEYLNINVEYVDQRQVERRYRAYQQVSVKLTKIDKFDEINTELIQRGITGINGPNFSSSREDRMLEEVRLEAVKDARRRAEALAGALGQKIGPAHAITDVEGGNQPMPMYRMAAMESADGGAGIATGEIVVEHSVTASFYLYSK